jgi:hypothetical protein
VNVKGPRLSAITGFTAEELEFILNHDLQCRIDTEADEECDLGVTPATHARGEFSIAANVIDR